MPDPLPPVLIVEDDEDGRLMMAEILRSSDYPVIEAENCQAARSRMQETAAVIVVSDLRLPDGNGLELIHELQKDHPSMIPLITTGYSTLETAIEAINEGAFAYLTKPFEPNALLSTIRQAVNKWRLETENRDLLQQTRAEADRVTALLQASEEINSAYMDTLTMTRRIVQTAVKIMAARAGFIGLQEDGSILVREWWDGQEWQSLHSTFKQGEGGPGYVWQMHTTYRSNDCLHDPRLTSNISPMFRPKTMICCPILTRYGEFLGALDLSDKNGGDAFTDNDVRFLEGLCRHIAVALENSRLYEDQRRSEQQRKQFYRDVVSAATRNKLILCEKWEMENRSDPPLLHMQIQEPSDISSVRYALTDLLQPTGIDEERMDGVILSVGEAVTNAYKHGGGGEVSVWVDDTTIAISVEDQGPGIDATTLPKATLMPGFSTKASLGIGLTVILDIVDQACLATTPEGTRLDLQISIHAEEMDLLAAFNSIHSI